MTFTEARRATSTETAWLFINRIAGGYDKPQHHARLRELLEELGLNTVEINSPEQLASQWEEEAAPRPDFIVSVGGDGTAAMIAGQTSGTVPIAIYPAGTENILAKYLGIPTNIGAFAKMLSHRVVRRLDAGQFGDRTFMLMLSAGLEAEVVHRVHQRRNGHLTKFHYVRPAFEMFAKYEYPQLELDIELEDGSRTQTQGYWAFAFNVPRYALGFEMTPDAVPDDGLLDICVLTQSGFGSTASYITSLLSGTIAHRSDVKRFKARSAEIRCQSGPVPLQTDGDPAGFTDIRLSVRPNYLPLIVPPARSSK
ncbi:diacylglycerol/lipid kinase family protein [Bremerella alba]|uniref:Diacylglycerol kinase n=1 Tax=Bremerella alba TaxID=980252 RepID=A0A7V8V6S2_9BACT|nr:diacylglycerol kinase family protein [Bremerella alba]MBA2116009.1 Diacylglycerol kinase [Bremerella alba]